MFHERSSNSNGNLISRQDLSPPLPGFHVAQHKDISRLPVLQKATKWIHKDLWSRESWDCQLQRSRLPVPPRLASSWINFSLGRHEARSFEAHGSHIIQVPRFLDQLWLLGTPLPLHPGISGNPRPAAQSQLIRLAVSKPGLHFLSQIIMKNNSWSNWNIILNCWKILETTWIIRVRTGKLPTMNDQREKHINEEISLCHKEQRHLDRSSDVKL